MSDRMHGLSITQLLDMIEGEYYRSETIFGIKPFIFNARAGIELFEERLDAPVGPAAGPHTQLAQNIIAAYVAGCRFFELKTVQKLDGEDLPVSKPCISAEDECYNVEWSTELTVENAYREYVKAWLVLKYLSLKSGKDGNGFIFNMSVGYDLEGIKLEKIDRFIEGLKDASDNEFYNECIDTLCRRAPAVEQALRSLSPCICNSVTLSTLHGCPANEIERIAAYLITEKKLNTYIKCNPTLLGYEYARRTLDEMGYDYICFDDRHFREDLHFEDAVPMIDRLMRLAAEQGVAFGVKLTNTFPVDIKENELPGEEMYMSGKSLYPLSLEVAARLSEAFDGRLRISFSGGADAFNIARIAECGIYPITFATTLLKSGGYTRCNQIVSEVLKTNIPGTVDVGRIRRLSNDSKLNARHVKPVKPLPNRKLHDKLPMFDCFTAPCMAGCPFGQDIPEYIRLVDKGQYLAALRLIVEKNPLPFITGAICAHHCMDKCTRNFYDDPVCIRSIKLIAANGGYDGLLDSVRLPKPCGMRVAVIGGGPAGLAAAYLLGKRGVEVTLFEKADALGGVVRNVIPDFRIDAALIDKDIELVKKYCSDIRLSTPAPSVAELKSIGYDAVVVAVGAEKRGKLKIDGNVINAIDYLSARHRGERTLPGGHVVVVGAGNTAMDTARAALREDGVTGVSIVYRRTKRYMPADAEELELAITDGVEFIELLSPVSFADGKLVCEKMALADTDANGRRSVISTGEQVCIECACVIAAVGESVDDACMNELGIQLENGRVRFEYPDNVFCIGDCLRGPATVAEAIADANAVVEKLLGNAAYYIPVSAKLMYHEALERHGKLMPSSPSDTSECERCLGCNIVCESCVDVCPNRANVAISVPGKTQRQILHLDRLCNECGNCKTFCPHGGAPYLDKLTLFETTEDFNNSNNSGFVILDADSESVMLRINGELCSPSCDPDVRAMIEAVIRSYTYLWK